MEREALAQIFATHRERYLEEWQTFLRFESISADPAYEQKCRECATWLTAHIATMGFESRLLETGTKPVVFGERKGREGAPVILFYGHYDVQPVDPIEAWVSPPFEPSVRDGRLYARGAQDNKGQLFYALKAMEALIAADALDATIKIFIEGEEECGSDGIAQQLDAWRDELASDLVMVCDTGSMSRGHHAVVMGLRGIVQLSVRVSGPRMDLHSGLHGGKAPNPAIALSRMLSSMYTEDGAIAIEGYYDAVAEADDRERELANSVPHDDAVYRAETGVPATGGDRRRTPAERVGFLPSLEINGIHSGYGGAGMKTIIPAIAEAKITSRTVADQDGAQCLAAVKQHLREHLPEGLAIEFGDDGVGGPPLRVDPDHPAVAKACGILEELSGQAPALLWEGASIPIVASLREAAGAESLLVGFGLEEDAIHAPNESFSFEQFETGFLYVGRFLSS